MATLRPPKLNIPVVKEGTVLSWYPDSALVRTDGGEVLRVKNPYGSQVHRKRVLIAQTTNGQYTIIGIGG